MKSKPASGSPGNPASSESRNVIPTRRARARNAQRRDGSQHQHVSAVVTLSGIPANAPVFADVYDAPGVDASTRPDSVFRRSVRARHGFVPDDAYGLCLYGGAFD
ncbi:MAG: hypothetical protein ACJ76R_14490 [Solirubrobacteraceae bacterium]